MSIIKLFHDVHSDGLNHGLYARKGIQIRKVNENSWQQAKQAIPFFNEPKGKRSKEPLVNVDKEHEDYSQFVHFAILEALWVDGEVLDESATIVVLVRLDHNT